MKNLNAEYFMSGINEILVSLNEYENCKIENKSEGNFILFDTPFKQPFPFGIMIEFNGLTGKECFTINVPARILRENNMCYFGNTILKLIQYVDKLNTKLGMYKMCMKTTYLMSAGQQPADNLS